MYENWLEIYLADTLERKLCTEIGCTTCGAMEFRLGVLGALSSATGMASRTRFDHECTGPIARALAELKPTGDASDALQNAVRCLLSDLWSGLPFLDAELEALLAGSWAGELLARMKEHHQAQQARRRARAALNDPANAQKRREEKKRLRQEQHEKRILDKKDRDLVWREKSMEMDIEHLRRQATSKDARLAITMIGSGRLHEAEPLAISAVEQDPNDWYAQYAIGQYYRFAQNYPKACAALCRANELGPKNPSVLVALAIARQLNGEYGPTVDALRLALEIEPDNAVAFNTLAMTQKLMGEFEKAAHNYDAGAQALSRTIVKTFNNDATSPRVPAWYSRANLWARYALFGGIYLAATASLDGMASPTGEMAERDERTQEFEGWYWQDEEGANGKRLRLFLPNYFNTFCSRLRDDPLYSSLMGNRSTVLRIMGNIEEADQHLNEAEAFSLQ